MSFAMYCNKSYTLEADFAMAFLVMKTTEE